MNLGKAVELILLAFIAMCCLLGWGLPGYRSRSEGWPYYILWFILGIIAIVVGVLLLI
jgi:hypothetical protein